jgi:hypothetical protein
MQAGRDDEDHRRALLFASVQRRMLQLAGLMWWLIHNLIAHPLLGVLGARGWVVHFHDWTAEKMLSADAGGEEREG